LHISNEVYELRSHHNSLVKKTVGAAAGMERDCDDTSFILRSVSLVGPTDLLCVTPRGVVIIVCNLVDPASSHMLVSKIKPCKSKYKFIHNETANGSLKQL
jgi:hypothetical protein